MRLLEYPNIPLHVEKSSEVRLGVLSGIGGTSDSVVFSVKKSDETGRVDTDCKDGCE